MTGSAQVAVLIATYNRAARLAETLDVLAMSHSDASLPWEVVVVDNNCTDQTREIVLSHQGSYPVPLRYVLERRQGRSAALNAAIGATSAPCLLITDDDVRVEPGWLLAGARALAGGADYVGGPVAPIWEVPPPRWLDLTRGDLWGTIAILDYGRERFAFENRQRVPLGANMGVRRSLVERVGGFRVDLGRTNGRRVLGQEVPELLARARAAELRGVYVPAMAVHHHIPASRLTKHYFRRWWIGKGYSKAILETAQPVTEMGLDLRVVPHLGSVPRFMVSDALRDVVGYLKAWFAGDECERSRREMHLAYAFGYVRARGIGRRPTYPATVPHTSGDSRAATGLALSKLL
jgi:glycosyltransferase involved in cell wall biosynthesis